MSIIATVQNYEIPATVDKTGAIILKLRDALVASGLWRVRGSGDGVAAFQLMGQTAGPNYNVHTNGFGTTGFWSTARSNSITQMRAWLVLEEIASGRCLAFQRSSQSSETYAGYWTVALGAGCAATGASANSPPALTAPSAFHFGTAWNSTGDANFVANNADVILGATSTFWMQAGVSDVVEAGNVAPFWFYVWNRTSGAPVMAGVWMSLVDSDSALVHPLAFSLGSPAYSVGQPGNATSGPGWILASKWRGGDDFSPVSFQLPAFTSGGTPYHSPPNYVQLNGAGKWYTERPFVYRNSIGFKLMGRLQHMHLNRVSREYPATYGLTGSTPRLTIGQLIVPWATGILPNSSP